MILERTACPRPCIARVTLITMVSHVSQIHRLHEIWCLRKIAAPLAVSQQFAKGLLMPTESAPRMPPFSRCHHPLVAQIPSSGGSSRHGTPSRVSGGLMEL